MAELPIVSRGEGRKPCSPVRIEGDIALVTLSNGWTATIDAEDADLVRQYRWGGLGRSWKARRKYAATPIGSNLVGMHRLILDAPEGMTVDHIDQNGLNNRRSNLRLATIAQNMANSGPKKDNRLGLKGVSQKRRRFMANITHEGKTTYLGLFVNKEDAAEAYRKAAIAIHGEFAYRPDQDKRVPRAIPDSYKGK